MTDFAIEELVAQDAAAVSAELPLDELPAFFHRAFTASMAAIADQGAGMAGPPFGYYPAMPGAVVRVIAGFPTLAAIEPAGDVEPFRLPGGPAIVGVHVGPFDTLEGSYHELLAWAQERGLTLAQGMWEVYLTDPGLQPDPQAWQTRIVWPVAG